MKTHQLNQKLLIHLKETLATGFLHGESVLSPKWHNSLQDKILNHYGNCLYIQLHFSLPLSSHFTLPSLKPLMPCKHSVLQPLPGAVPFLYCHVSNSIVLQGPQVKVTSFKKLPLTHSSCAYTSTPHFPLSKHLQNAS